MTYDDTADAMYIRLTENAVVRSKQINANFVLDLDERGEVIGIEVLNVRKSGIDPLSWKVSHTASDQEVARPDPETIQQGRRARMETLKRERAAQKKVT